MTPHEFYNSTKWERMRAFVLRRDQYACVICRRYGRLTEAKTVHHIKHLEDNWELRLDPNNLISVCSKCHNKLHPEKGGKAWKHE